jgi:hypothetical protein
MTIHERIKIIAKWLIGTGAATNQEQLGKLLGYSNKSSFSQVVNGRVPLPDDFIDRLCSINQNINKVWIMNGTGTMINNSIEGDNDSISLGHAKIISNDPSKLNEAKKEINHLKEMIAEKDKLIEEKERLINVLMNKQ